MVGCSDIVRRSRAVRVPGGYRLTGSCGFCTGSDSTESLFFNAPAGEDGEGHMFLVPREDATTIDDWFPTGMRATGSRPGRRDRGLAERLEKGGTAYGAGQMSVSPL
jgi:alkylation response protein AidB-like acyl-CoA dehydrogenase